MAGPVNLWAIDTETTGLHPDDGADVVVLSACRRNKKTGELEAWAWPSLHATNPEWPKMDPERWRQICYRFARPDSQLIFHNSKFDLTHMAENMRGLQQSEGGILKSLVTRWIANTVWDTMLTHKILEGEYSAALKTIARRMWGDEAAASADELEEWFVSHRQKQRPRYAELPWPLISRYAKQDVRLTYRLFEWQHNRLEEGTARERALVLRELQFSHLVLGMELRGIGFDVESARESRAILEREIKLLDSQLPFRATLPAAKAYYFNELGLTPANTTKSGAPALTERDVDTLAKQGAPFADIFWKRQAVQSMIAKWYGPWPESVGRDGRLRPTFNLAKVRSMRLSVERVQVQAIPHIRHFVDLDLPEGVALPRELFLAKPRHQLWEVDLSQGEVRIASAMADCKAMKEIVARPKADVHGLTCKRVFRIDEKAPNWKTMRDITKRLNFGIIYGAGPVTLRKTIFVETGIDVPLREMEDMVKDYRRTFPEFVTYSRSQERFCEDRGYVVLVSGKRRYFNTGPPIFEKPHTAFNAIIQGGLAETMRDVMLEVDQEFPGTLLLQIHDSLVLELPKTSGEGIMQKIRAIMIRIYEQQYGVPFDADYDLWENKK